MLSTSILQLILLLIVAIADCENATYSSELENNEEDYLKILFLKYSDTLLKRGS